MTRRSKKYFTLRVLVRMLVSFTQVLEYLIPWTNDVDYPTGVRAGH
jgi:hypothetical protein